MIDSGIRSGPDIARCLACGARFTFLGRTFMYSVAALGTRGGNHAIAMLKMQFKQVLEQLGCQTAQELPTRLIR
jgi:L-lactate dehydrogenase (cytochrome)